MRNSDIPVRRRPFTGTVGDGFVIFLPFLDILFGADIVVLLGVGEVAGDEDHLRPDDRQPIPAEPRQVFLSPGVPELGHVNVRQLDEPEEVLIVITQDEGRIVVGGDGGVRGRAGAVLKAVDGQGGVEEEEKGVAGNAEYQDPYQPLFDHLRSACSLG